MELKDSNTLQNLKDAFAGIQANRRYLYFGAKADVEGENDGPRYSDQLPKATDMPMGIWNTWRK